MLTAITFIYIQTGISFAGYGVALITDSGDNENKRTGEMLLAALKNLRKANKMTKHNLPIMIFDISKLRDARIANEFFGVDIDDVPYCEPVKTARGGITRKLGGSFRKVSEPGKVAHKIFARLQKILGKRVIKKTSLKTRIKLKVDQPKPIILIDKHVVKPKKNGLIILKPGEHEITVQKINYLDYHKEINLRYGEIKIIPVEMVYHQGTIILETDPPKSEVYFKDLKMSYKTPLYEEKFPAGKHHLIITQMGYKKWEGDIFIPGKDKLEKTIKLSPLQVKVYLEVVSKRFAEKDQFSGFNMWTIDRLVLEEKLKKYFKEKGCIKPVFTRRLADYVMEYFVELDDPMKVKVTIKDLDKKPIFSVSGEMKRPDENSKCANRAIEILDKKIMPELIKKLSEL
ncbi:MAG: PEGA domain-containing protein [Candidatus Eremiobacteraeota bacterium]|nr:PEGA domain-containing protein [Candidatus Eremiobacteraeota bacterium]